MKNIIGKLDIQGWEEQSKASGRIWNIRTSSGREREGFYRVGGAQLRPER